jgi:putative ABC transport system permease protein
VTGLGWGVRSLGRQRLRTALSVLGIAVAAAMLLDMVMLSGGIDKSFAELVLARGFQIRITPKGTLPFDTEATMSGATQVLAEIRRDPDVELAGAVLGTPLFGSSGDSLTTFFGYGIEPEAQGLYQVTAGSDLTPADAGGVLLSPGASKLLHASIGDTVTLVGKLDPQAVASRPGKRLAVRGIVRWLYDARGQASVGTILPVMQRLAGQTGEDRVSILIVKVRRDGAVGAVAQRLRRQYPRLEVNSVADLVIQFRKRLVYFRQLSFILGSMSLIVTVLLVATILTIGVNERLGEIATLRAIGVSRATVVRQVLSEGTALTLVGAALGIALGLGSARYLDAILTSFPGLPAAFSFFVPRADALATAAAVLMLTGVLAGAYPAWLAARAPIAATLRAEAT